MKPYIYSIFFFLGVQITFSQSTELVLKDSYSTDANTILNIDIDNASIVFKESDDNKVYFDYNILFGPNSEEVEYKVFKGIRVKSSMENNMINLNVKNSMYLGELYTLNVDINAYKDHIKTLFKIKKENEFIYKSKDSLLSEINFSLGSDTDDYFKKLKLKNPNKDYGKSPRKFKQQFVIKVPKSLKIKIKALHSKIDFTYDVNTLLEVNSFQTYYKFKKINNSKNKFNLINGIFQAEEISGGNFDVKDLRKVRIGAINQVKLRSETSKIQIGEVGKKLSIKDFNSKLHIYNFSNDFSKFNLTGDYTKLNLYKVKESPYAMNVFGLKTTLNLNGVKTTFGKSDETEFTKILEKKPKENIANTIEIELKNGVIHIK